MHVSSPNPHDWSILLWFLVVACLTQLFLSPVFYAPLIWVFALHQQVGSFRAFFVFRFCLLLGAINFMLSIPWVIFFMRW